MPEITDERLAELRALADAAEGLPWTLHNTSTLYMNGKAEYYTRRDDKPGQAIHLTCSQAEAELIVAAVNALPELLAEVERLRGEAAAAELAAVETHGQLVEERDRHRAELAKAREAIAGIRQLHQQYRDVYATTESGDSCSACNTADVRVPWPCQTIRELSAPSAVEAASTVPADAVTALRDAGILACGTEQMLICPRVGCSSTFTSEPELDYHEAKHKRADNPKPAPDDPVPHTSDEEADRG